MGKKKKSLASKFAKMTDDQRAKYMQLKADQEEEVRRRKEQLLNTFMKNKIKKEDGFSRLNRAKINLQWHQFLRIRKCREMKENCQHLKRWIGRVVGLKNKIIDNLVKELDEAEFQYSNNLQSHLLHIDEMIDFYNRCVDQLKKLFTSDSNLLLEECIIETGLIKRKSENSQTHLKTTIYGQDSEDQASLQKDRDYYLKHLDKFSKECKDEMRQLKKSMELKSGAIWRDIAETARTYVDQTDKRRAQLAEMKRLDAETAQEISRNQERIEVEEVQIQKYKDEYKTLVTERTETIKTLNNMIEDLKATFLKSKITLKKELEGDDEKLRVLSQYTKEAVDNLESIERRGDHLLHLAQSCRKYETQKEKVLRFHRQSIEEKYFVGSAEDEEEINGDLEDILKVTVQEQKEIEAPEEDENGETLDDEQSSLESGSNRNDIFQTQTYKILIHQKFKLKPTTSQVDISEKLRKELEKIDLSSTCTKRKQKTLSSNSSTKSSAKPSMVIDECVTSLMQLNGMWDLYNKVKIDCSELRAEKTILLEENKRYKNMLKSILEQAVLESRTVQRKDVRIKRYASAPVRYT